MKTKSLSITDGRPLRNPMVVNPWNSGDQEIGVQNDGMLADWGQMASGDEIRHSNVSCLLSI